MSRETESTSDPRVVGEWKAAMDELRAANVIFNHADPSDPLAADEAIARLQAAELRVRRVLASARRNRGIVA